MFLEGASSGKNRDDTSFVCKMNGNDGAPTTAQGVLREPPPLLVEVFPERLDSALSSLEQALRRQIQIGDERPPVQLGSPIFDGHTSSDDDELVEDEDGQDVEQQEAAAGNALDFLTNDVSTRIELHQVARVAEQSIPFVLLLLLVRMTSNYEKLWVPISSIGICVHSSKRYSILHMAFLCAVQHESNNEASG